jgi:hypothetical protein
VASDKKRWNTKAVPDVPEPLVIGVTRARAHDGLPKEPGTSGTTGTAAGGLIFTFDLGGTTGWALSTADGTILVARSRSARAAAMVAACAVSVSEVGSIKWFTENLVTRGFQQPRDRRARVHHVVPLTGTDPRKGAHS